MITIDLIEARRDLIGEAPVMVALMEQVGHRVARLLREPPPVPAVKAMLSRDGGTCPEDGAPLRFDPWSPDQHQCPACGKRLVGERHHRHWARAQHLWLGERMVDLAVLAAVEDDPHAAAIACDLIARYEGLYFECLNQDNVLGPSHLFFSTYLESIWLLHFLAAGFILREAGLLPDERVEGISRVADEAAQLIGEFNEGYSNRQTWNAAALTAVAAWFGDEDLAQTTIESRTGLAGHLADGFGEDGMWSEGENYHLFALRGLMLGIQWARVLGADLLEDAEVRRHFRAALLAPSLTALPDLTFPARKDSRFGVSLAQPAYLELWEVGRTWLGNDEELDGWLAALYAVPAPAADHYDAWLHDAGLPGPASRSLANLSSWALLEAAPPPESRTMAQAPARSLLLESQGLAVLRQGGRYLSLECGAMGGGHGHPDRLHLTLHARGVHWLPDPGAGSYVERRLEWYRSPLAHNAPMVDGWSPGRDDVRCEAFETGNEWSWARGRAGEVSRTVVVGPDHLVDVVELSAREDRELLLPWHLAGDLAVTTPGHWESARFEGEWTKGTERFVPGGTGPIGIEVTSAAGPLLRVTMLGPAEVLRATGPGLPGDPRERAFLVQRIAGATARLITVLDWSEAADRRLTEVRRDDAGIQLTTTAGTTGLRFVPTGLVVSRQGMEQTLGGIRPAVAKARSLFEERATWDALAEAPHAWEPPVLDGSLDGFDLSAPVALAGEHQYRRSEEPYDESFAAQGWVNWDREAFYLAVAVAKPEVVVRPEDAPPLNLDNEPDDIHSDGIQVYFQLPDGTVRGDVLTLGQEGRLMARPVEGLRGGGPVTGAWSLTEEGYLILAKLPDPMLAGARPGTRLGFDLLVNEARPHRLRRAGQLVWSGGEGWVYLRGDRQDPARFGRLELG